MLESKHVDWQMGSELWGDKLRLRINRKHLQVMCAINVGGWKPEGEIRLPGPHVDPISPTPPSREHANLGQISRILATRVRNSSNRFGLSWETRASANNFPTQYIQY